MFGMGMNEILVILVVAMIFLGPDKLPGAAKTISKGIRDLRKQTREFQDTIESDNEIGGAIRDLKSALRGEEIRRPPVRTPPPAPAIPPAESPAAAELPVAVALAATPAEAPAEAAQPEATSIPEAAPSADPPAPSADLPAPSAQADPDGDDAAALIRPAAGNVGRGQA